MKNRLFFFMLVGMLSIFSFVHAEQDEVSGLQISPNRFDWNMTGGDSKEFVIHLFNHDDKSHDVKLEVEDFVVLDDTMHPSFFIPYDNHPRKAYDIINWITKPSDFTIAPKTSKDVTFSVQVPEGQPTNGYYGGIFFRTSTSDAKAGAENGASIKVNYRVGSLVTMAIQGDEPMRIEGSVESFGALKKVFWESPMTIITKLYSSGNIHYRTAADGEIVVNKFGKKFAVIKVDPENMYPDRTRTFKEFIEFGSWDHGIYSATLDMKSEDSDVIFKAESPIFFVIPWKTTAVALGAIVLIIIIIKTFKKKFKIVPNKKKRK